VGYHVGTAWQGRGLATEAAAACRDLARERIVVGELVAITHPDNRPSQRVAEKIGMHRVDDDHGGASVRSVHSMRL
jgi:RimJ/RimL family protein N-acetyltransferase